LLIFETFNFCFCFIAYIETEENKLFFSRKNNINLFLSEIFFK
jgi:hypothetical protein